MEPTLVIDGRCIDVDHPPYLVAEMSANHGGQIERAFSVLAAAKAAGADAVKLQTYTPDTMTIDHDGDDFVIEGGLWHGRKLYDLYGEAQTPWEWHDALFRKGRELGITVFSTPFDETAVDFLESLGAPAYKIASFEAIDLPLIHRVALTGKPVIISTGNATLGEIAEAVETVRNNGNRQLALLHCVSAYPAPPEDMNLRTISHLAETFGVVAGLSDHTLGTAVSVAGASVGAAIIEKHFTFRRADGGPDAAFSLEPDEFARLATEVRTAHAALGHVSYERQASERANLAFRRSIYAVADIAKDEVFTTANVRSIRPGHGLPPKHLIEVIGRRAVTAIRRGTPLAWSLVK